MIVLVEHSRLPVAPKTLWAWFLNFDDHYRDLHSEHLTWRTLRGEPLTDGAIVFFDEWVGRARLSGRSFIGDVEEERHFAFQLGFPGSLVGAGGSFTLEPTSDGACELTQVVQLGFDLPLLGALVDRVLGLVVPLTDLRRHMREEQENLVRLLSPQGG